MNKTPAQSDIREFIIAIVKQGFGDQYEMLTKHAQDAVVDMLCTLVDVMFAGANDDERFMTTNQRFLELWILNAVVLKAQCKGSLVMDACQLLAVGTKFQTLDRDDDLHQ